MFSHWQLSDLINLVRHRYPAWDGFHHPPFVADEIAAKRATAARARDLLNENEMRRLVSNWAYDELRERLIRLGRDNNLLWTRVPQRGDLALLYRPDLDNAEFSLQMVGLLYGSEPVAARLQRFSTYALAQSLPNKWTFPTYFLFFTYPEAELFIQPQVARWFLKYVGRAGSYSPHPDGHTYTLLRRHAHALRDALVDYEARDMIDVQSFLWVCSRESRRRTGRLDVRAQVELDVPPPYAVAPRAAFVADEPGVYDLEADEEEVTDGDPSMQDAPVGADDDSVQPIPPYPLAALATGTGYDTETLQPWIAAIRRKGQAIFYGPPGTGKTRLAQHIARHLVGGGDGFVDLVQFHAAYQYEDFVQGLRPVPHEGGGLSYELVPGRFLAFCREAAARTGPCVLIIDEINRADLSRVFGELMYLLEYRERTIPLATGGQFSIPANVLIIGTMNTADRSIALVDHALRRRFAFIALRPNYELLRRYHQDRQPGIAVDRLVTLLREINEAIGDPNYELGITYFLRPHLGDVLRDVWQMEIEPYLEEFFFDRPEDVDPFRWEQVQARLEKSTDEHGIS